MTPLYLASLYGHSDIVKILLDKGAEVNSKTIGKSNEEHSQVK